MHNTRGYWNDQLKKFHNKLSFDGLWLDANEITSQCDAQCYADQGATNPLDNRLFYWPGGRDLELGTISLDAVHEGGIQELDAHNLYGLLQSYYTSEWFADQKKRAFVISRSTFAGSGKYAGHWLGDNDSEFQHLRYSVSNILLFSTFGIPFTGADICGFNSNSSLTLCTKWYKVATIYPFARNHNNFGMMSQEPYQDRFNESADATTHKTSQQIMRKAMLMRYGIHNYVYTQFHKASTDGIAPIKPLFFNYPSEPFAYENTFNDVLIGDAIKASLDTALSESSTYFFPERGAVWCPIWQGLNNACIQGGSRNVMQIPMSEIYLHIGPGHIIPLQLSNSTAFDEITDINNLDDLQNYKTDVGILLNGNNAASGSVRFDGGETLNYTQYDEIKFAALATTSRFFGGSTLTVTFNATRTESIGPMTNSQKLGEILIYRANNVGLTRIRSGTLLDRSGNFYQISLRYDSVTDVSRISYNATEAIPLKNLDTLRFETS